MLRAKVISLDEYRNKRLYRQRNLRSMIEGHLAEAGLLDKVECICLESRGDSSNVMENCWEPWDSEMVVETTER
jgi:hypothetical protein